MAAYGARTELPSLLEASLLTRQAQGDHLSMYSGTNRIDQQAWLPLALLNYPHRAINSMPTPLTLVIWHGQLAWCEP